MEDSLRAAIAREFNAQHLEALTHRIAVIECTGSYRYSTKSVACCKTAAGRRARGVRATCRCWGRSTRERSTAGLGGSRQADIKSSLNDRPLGH